MLMQVYLCLDVATSGILIMHDDDNHSLIASFEL